jgi:hypothetical protein
MAREFYVYRILGEMGETVYIGKGTGKRLNAQKRRFLSDPYNIVVEPFPLVSAA